MLVIFAVHSNSGVYNFQKATIVAFVMYGDFSPSETRMIEKYASNLPKRVKPYVFVRKWGEIWWKVNE